MSKFRHFAIQAARLTAATAAGVGGVTAATVAASAIREEYRAYSAALARYNPVLFLAEFHARHAAKDQTLTTLLPQLKERGYDCYIEEGIFGLEEPITLDKEIERQNDRLKWLDNFCERFPGLQSVLAWKENKTTDELEDELRTFIPVLAVVSEKDADIIIHKLLHSDPTKSNLKLHETLKELGFDYRNADEKNQEFQRPESLDHYATFMEERDETMAGAVQNRVRAGHGVIASFGALHFDGTLRRGTLPEVKKPAVNKLLEKEGIPSAVFYIYDGCTSPDSFLDERLRKGTSGITPIDTHRLSAEEVLEIMDSKLATAQKKFPKPSFVEHLARKAAGAIGEAAGAGWAAVVGTSEPTGKGSASTGRG